MPRSWVRLLFCIAAALLATAIADPILESASNQGLFGRGSFTDHSTLDVIPTLLMAAILASVWVVLRVRGSLAIGTTTWSVAAAALDTRGLARLLPWIFASQIVALFSMESIEQTIVFGHLLGGTIWLGAPVLVALAVHAVFCVGLSLLLAAMLRASAASLTHLIEALIRFFSRYEPRRLATPHLRRRAISVRHSQPTLCRLGERAPPALTI